MTKRLIFTAAIVLFIALILLPYINGRLAEREIRSFFKRSPVGEEAVRYYERGYFKSDCVVEFDGYELMTRTLSEKELANLKPILTNIVLQSDFSIYHCPSLKDKTFYCKGEGKTVVKAPGHIIKNIDLKASLGWDACVRATFRIPGGSIEAEKLGEVFPEYEWLSYNCELSDITGEMKIPLGGREATFKLCANGLQSAAGSFTNFVLQGSSRVINENVRAYCFTGDLENVKGNGFNAKNGKLYLNGSVSNKLHNISLDLNSETQIEDKTLPVDLKLQLKNCHLEKLNEIRTTVTSLKQQRNAGISLNVISKFADVMESGKEFLKCGPGLDCAGIVTMPEGDGTLKFRLDTSKVKLNNWRDIFRLQENLDGGLDIILPQAALKEGGTMNELFNAKEDGLIGQAVLSNGYYVIHKDLRNIINGR
ncbi:hypothetical protein IJS98_07040 [bacterium]|nr:hypothetical protein [bacterium]